MLIWLATIVAFIYLIYRVNEIEHKLNRLSSGKTEVLPKTISETATASLGVVKKEVPIIPAPAPIKPTPVVAEKTNVDWEQKLGSKFFTIIGAVAIVFGVGFFLKYAFDHNLISETARIILGLLAGVAIIITGQVTEKKYPAYGQLLTGLGLAVIYLSIFASFNYYHLISQLTAFVAMVLATTTGIALALKSDSEALAGFAQFGGFLTPLLLSTGHNSPHELFGYLFLLDVAIILISLYRPWQNLNLGSLIGTIILFSGWFFPYYNTQQFGIAFGYATLFFLTFLTATLIHYVVQKAETNERTLSLLSINTFFYYLVSYVLLNRNYPDLTGYFTFGLGAAYLVLGLATMQKQRAKDYFSNFLFGLSFLLFFVAIPIQFDKFAVSIGWGAEALILIVIGFQMSARPIRYVGHFVFVASTLYTIFYSAIIKVHTPWVNYRGVNALLIVMTLMAAAYIYWQKKSHLESAVVESSAPSTKNEFAEAATALTIQAYLILFWVISLEITQFYKSFWLTIAWGILSLGLATLGTELKNGVLRTISYMSILLVIGRLLFFESVDVKTYTPFFNSRVGTFLFSIAILCLLSYMLNSRKNELNTEEREIVLPSIFFGTNVLALWLMSFEILNYYDKKALISFMLPSKYANIKNTLLSVSWLVYAIITLIAGITYRHKAARLFALLLFGIVIAKVFLNDTVNLNNLYRFISYLVLGVILLFAGYLYNRYKDRILEFIKASD